MPTRRRFQPTLWPTIITVPALIVLVALGTLQVDRLQWKSALIENFETMVSQPLVPPPQSVSDWKTWRFRRVSMTGVYQHQKEILLTGKTFEGTAGFHVITPFLVRDGRIILVNRGWVPDKLSERERRPETLIQGLVKVEGILRQDKRRGYFVPDNEPNNEVWLYVDTDEMSRHREIVPVASYYVDAIRRPGPYALPIGATTEVTVRNEHLQYAITWYLLAATLAVIYFIYHYRRPDEE
ncbi:MAG: surfeit locus 1 family protein [Rhodospirillaceae bacterium]|nr:surfeit locus 1 family protein [Rhodospirillaceae bacterium]